MSKMKVPTKEEMQEIADKFGVDIAVLIIEKTGIGISVARNIEMSDVTALGYCLSRTVFGSQVHGVKKGQSLVDFREILNEEDE